MKSKKKFRLAQFIQMESSGSILLFASMLFALILANSPFQEGYQKIWHQVVFGMSLEHWINDGLMAIFFFVVGLEIRREFTIGELSSPKKAALPIAAALGGMIVPALIYSFFNWNTPERSGWGIPMATDIAFALGVLAALGKRIPLQLKVFLMALAIVDDLGAVSVIAVFYTQQIIWIALALGSVALIFLKFCNRFKKLNSVFYLLVGIFVWFCFLKSGVHATVAGVLLALVVPFSLVRHLEHLIHPYVVFGILPLFAFSNSGVSFAESNLAHPVSLGIILGLVIGKQVGITLFAWVAVKVKVATLPQNTSWFKIYGIACLGGIGFTMSIFISNLGLSSEVLSIAKSSILIASAVASLLGVVILIADSKHIRQ